MIMTRGKQTCKILKDIRRQIAEANGIEFATSECRYKGDCLGTCPKCEAEVRYLEQQIRARSLSGRAVAIAGISAASLAMLVPTALQARPMADIPSVVTTDGTAQDSIIVKGVVYDGDQEKDGVKDLEPLFGASVCNMSSKKGVSTDLNGCFEIKARRGDKISISYVGLKEQIFEVNDAEEPREIVMITDESMLMGESVYINPKQVDIPAVDLILKGEKGDPIDLDNVEVSRLYIDEDGDPSEDYPRIYRDEKDTAIRVFWEDMEHGDNSLKEVTLRIEIDGYDDTNIIKVKKPKHSVKKTVRFKHPSTKR